MTFLFLLLAITLLSLCLTWTRLRLWFNIGLLTVISLITLGVYFTLGYPQAYVLKDKIAQINEDPASVDYDEVYALLDQHLFWHSNDALARIFQGRLYFASQDYELAAQSFEKAYALLPDDADLMVEYATTLYITGQSPDVLAKLIRELIAHDDMPYSAHSLLANIAMDQGEIELAKTHWQALLRFIPKDSTEARQVQNILSQIE